MNNFHVSQIKELETYAPAKFFFAILTFVDENKSRINFIPITLPVIQIKSIEK